ncbi:hypothetical protein C8Q79DRAFT_1016363 [Trametes meyenii]|nr:hypothetical protein C8Q79DRAFT_1016363 [Trametes meyenii]
MTRGAYEPYPPLASHVAAASQPMRFATVKRRALQGRASRSRGSGRGVNENICSSSLRARNWTKQTSRSTDVRVILGGFSGESLQLGLWRVLELADTHHGHGRSEGSRHGAPSAGCKERDEGDASGHRVEKTISGQCEWKVEVEEGKARHARRVSGRLHQGVKTRALASGLSGPNDVLTIWLAILALLDIDFSINAVQAVDRALIVDTLPRPTKPTQTPGQPACWASEVSPATSCDTELEVLAIVGSFLPPVTHGITSFCTKEKLVVATRVASKSFLQELCEIGTTREHPVLTWPISSPVTPGSAADARPMWPSTLNVSATPYDPALDAEATCLGTHPLFYQSLLSVTANILLPFFVAKSARSHHGLERRRLQAHKSAWARIYEQLKVSLATLWAMGYLYNPHGRRPRAPGNEDANSIILHGTRTHRLSGDVTLAGDAHEQQFLVYDDEDEDGDREDTRKDGVRSLEGDDEDEEHTNRPTSRQAARVGIRAGVGEGKDTLLNNLAVRMSHLNVHPLAASDDAMLRGGEDEDATKSRQELTAKASIIIFTMAGLASLISFLDPVKTAPDVENGSSLASNTTDSAGSGTGAHAEALA